MAEETGQHAFFYCGSCQNKISAGYLWQGTTVRCPWCEAQVFLEYRQGQSIPLSGRSISYKDFLLLVRDDNAQALIAALLGCRVARVQGRCVLLDFNDAAIPFERAHVLIQSEPSKQADLYNLAMSLWR